jgi:hypothetical protein
MTKLTQNSISPNLGPKIMKTFPLSPTCRGISNNSSRMGPQFSLYIYIYIYSFDFNEFSLTKLLNIQYLLHRKSKHCQTT